MTAQRIVSISSLTLILLYICACNTSSQNLDEKQVESLFPYRIMTYELESFEKKIKSEAITEFKATYKSDKGEIKVVVTDWLEERPTDWTPKQWWNEAQASGVKQSGFPALIERKSDKEALMVMISKRVRVESKSTMVFGNHLKAFANLIDYSGFAELAKKRGD